MKKGKRISFGLGVGALLLLASCNKLLEMTEQGRDDRVVSKSVPQKYRIKTMSAWHPTDSTIAYFNYNEAGDPTSIIFSHTTTGRLNGFFRYQQNRQLRDYFVMYDSSHFEHWWRYVYDSSGRVIQDTLYQMGVVGPDGPLQNQTLLVSDYTYDRYGRVARTNTHVLIPNTGGRFERTYEYDIRGNLVPGDFVYQYDSKISIFRTHDVWQLVNKNFSRNNLFLVDEYNEAGLPTQFHMQDEFVYFHFLQHNIPGARIKVTYE
ncbi:hypothetical protein [Paraflavitalea pollutisoli]|uniref:hypothetical protein n=1 Tax=Paraflavitalea pollutisoli TaxID=3034143 RepID=UPI0023EBA3A0|nr:hypothetical protein [Paraflavitalea sp. H1-2-19X]